MALVSLISIYYMFLTGWMLANETGATPIWLTCILLQSSLRASETLCVSGTVTAHKNSNCVWPQIIVEVMCHFCVRTWCYYHVKSVWCSFLFIYSRADNKRRGNHCSTLLQHGSMWSNSSVSDCMLCMWLVALYHQHFWTYFSIFWTLEMTVLLKYL